MRPAPRSALRLVLAAIAVVLLATALTLYAARRIIAREALTGWLNARGIASDVEVEAFSLSGFTGRLRIGEPANPDFTAERVEVGYGFRGLALEVRRVRLRGAVLRASFRDGRFSAGSLDPLIEEFRRRPPRPDLAQPQIDIEQGRLRLATDYGPVDLTANATIRDAKLMSLDAVSTPMQLAGKGFKVDAGRAVLALRTVGGRLRIGLDAPLAKIEAGAAQATAGQLKLAAELPYPDLTRQRGDGAVVVNAGLNARRISLGEQSLAEPALTIAFRGQSAGWIPDLVVTGEGGAQLRAASFSAAAGRAGALNANATARRLRWSRKGGDAVSAELQFDGAAADLAAGDLRIASLTARGAGQAAFNQGSGARADVSLAAAGRGGWLGLGAPTKADGAQLAAIKRATRSFTFAAPGAQVTLAGSRTGLRLTQPVRLTSEAGGAVVLAPRGQGYLLTSAGGSLPEARAEIASFQMLPGGARARGRVHAALSIGPVEQGVVDGAGTLSFRNGAMRFDAARCAPLKAVRLELGANDVSDLAGRLCPAGGPLFTMTNGAWRVLGRAEAVSAAAPFLQVRISEGQGSIDFRGSGAQMDGRARITRALVSDTAPQMRFYPLGLAGAVDLVRQVWTGRLEGRSGEHLIGTAVLRHDGVSAVGGIQFDTGVLAFADGGLQPAQLSPLAAAIGSPAQGSAQFTGALDWTPSGATSRGELTVPRLDFTSPAGRITGLAGHIVFTSLAPLVAAQGQTLHADTLSAIVPLTNITATFGVADEALHVTGGEAAVGGGTLRLESLDLPFTPGAAISGVLNVDGVQLHDLVEASPFGDKVDLDAKVSGRIPFNTAGGAIHVLEGNLRAIQPGRLSIDREALTQVSGSGGTASVTDAPAPLADAVQPTNTFTDFAYQAMENLAFDTLDAGVNSLPEGRLGILFHIIGRHDPPQRQEIRLTLMDLIGRRFMNKPLPLPSGTGVNLTLDTTVNLDQLLGDYADYQRLRSSTGPGSGAAPGGSAAVQP